MIEHLSRKVLLADNDLDYRHSLRALLELENWKVEEADSVGQALDKLETFHTDLAIVDLRLSNDKDDHDISGLEVAKKARERGIPCIIITAFPSVEVTRRALSSRGTTPLADDFVPKAVGPQAILDAINILFNNSNQKTAMTAPELKIDLGQKLVWYKEEPLDLSRYQYAFLAYLYKKMGVVCEPQELIKAVYETDLSAKEAMTDKRLEHLVERLREKLEENPSNPKHLLNVQGRGFRLVM